MTVRVYLAAKLQQREELRVLVPQLQVRGIEITSRWIWLDDAFADETTDPEFQIKWARWNLEDIKKAHVLVLINDPRWGASPGKNIEFGYTLGCLKKARHEIRTLVVGEPQSIFHHLASLQIPLTYEAEKLEIAIMALAGYEWDLERDRWKLRDLTQFEVRKKIKR